LNKTAPRFATQELDRNQCIQWTSAEIFPRWMQRRNFVHSLQVAEYAMQMDVHQTLCPFYPISLCWLSLNSESFVWNVFYIAAIRNAFLFINCLISNFTSTFQK